MVDLSHNAKIVLKERYLLKDKKGNIIETPEDMFMRSAKLMASVELLYGKTLEYTMNLQNNFFKIMNNLEFIPNSPTLMNAGTKFGMLSACFRIDVPDSMEGIFNAVYKTAMIHKQGGGTGFYFGNLRPEGAIVKSTGGKASGPISFMSAFNATTEVVKQGGKRRGANMGVLNINHSDIEKFITCKKTEGVLNNFNLSVGITDEFMNNKDEKLWNLLCETSWINGEPAVLFYGNIEKDNPTPSLGKLEATNPCGELPLLPWESCNLGSINLGKFVKYGKIDYQRLSEVVQLAVRFLDNVIDANKYPFPEIEAITKGNRKIGLGVMGWADMLIKLGIKYDSEEALELADNVMEFIQLTAKMQSQELAKEKGNFPNFNISAFPSKEYNFMRNATVTSIAPTGTISIIADASFGIEPVFSIIQKRNVQDSIGTTLLEINPAVKEILKNKGYWSEIKKALASGCIKCVIIPKSIKELIPTANDISPEFHIRMQSVFQKHVDNSISKTVNLPESATVEDIKKIYELAWKLGCKGTTVYRNNSRKYQLLEANDGACPTCPS